MRPNSQENVDLFTFMEEILNGKLHFFVSRIAPYFFYNKLSCISSVYAVRGNLQFYVLILPNPNLQSYIGCSLTLPLLLELLLLTNYVVWENK